MDWLFLITAGLGGGLVLAAFLGKMGLGPSAACAAAILGGAAWASTRPPATPPSPDLIRAIALLGLLPILYASGWMLGGRLRERGAARGALMAAVHLAVKAFFAGGLAYFLIPWTRLDASWNPHILASIIGLAVCIGDPWPVFSPDGSPDDRERRAESQALWGAFLGLTGWVVLHRSLLRPETPAMLGHWVLLAETIVKDAGAGLCAGFCGALAGGRIRGWPIHWITALAALLLSRILRQDGLLAILLSGAFHAAIVAGRPPQAVFSAPVEKVWKPVPPALETRLPRAAADGGGSEWCLLGALAVSLALGASLPEILRPGAWPASAAIWGGGILAAGLLGLAASGSRRGAAPVPEPRWRDALFFFSSSYAGVAAGGSLLVLGLAGSVADGALGAPREVLVACAQALALGLLAQGLAAPLLRRGKNGAASVTWRAWQALEGRWLALHSFQRTLKRLESEQLLSETAAASMDRTLREALQTAEMERQALIDAHPEIERSRWTLAMRTALLEARHALEEEARRGRIAPEIARAMASELAAEWEAEISWREAVRPPPWSPRN